MTGKEIALQALRNEETPRPAWVPSVGSHGAQLIGETAETYLQSADLILKGMKKAKELYTPDGLPVIFDLQLGAEVLGCDLHRAKDGPPSATTHPLEEDDNGSAEQLPALDFTAGRFPLVFDAVEKAREEMGHDTALYG